MRKLFLLSLVVLATFGAAVAQAQLPQNNNANEIPNMGRAPKQTDGIGRLDLRVVDEQGNPVQGVRADLESRRGDGFLCESWNWTDARGVSVLPPIHMGRLTLKLKAKGFETQKVEVAAYSLNEPVRVTLIRKK
jgi:hypothetical protein